MGSGIPQSIVFNYHGPIGTNANVRYMYASEPIIQLVPSEYEEAHPESIQRNAAQRAILSKKNVSIPNSMFGASLDWRLRTYSIYSLGPDSVRQLNERGPAASVDRTTFEQDTAAVAISDPNPKDTDRRICLFNVLVALEWTPDTAYLHQLEWAFRRASDLLYDVTDGYMAFGQVVFGGRDMMDCADIQIMASNRVLPRSWVDGLKNADKYQPIRMGRGIWHDRNQVTIPWEEPEGYRTIIHEWGHYALSLLDKYIEPRPFKGSIRSQTVRADPVQITVPKRRLTSISIMETLEGTSELVSQVSTNISKKDAAWKKIDDDYRWLRAILDRNTPTIPGPRQLPFPLPQFWYLGIAKPDPTAPRLAKTLLDPQIIPGIPNPKDQSVPPKDSGFLSRYWTYILTRNGQNEYDRMIAQGTLDARSWEESFELLGAEPNSSVLVFAEPHDQPPQTFYANLEQIGSDQLGITEFIPLPTDDQHIIDVIPLLPEQVPNLSEAERSAYSHSAGPFYLSIRVRNVNQETNLSVWLFPQGQTTSYKSESLSRLAPDEAALLGLNGANDWVSSPVKVPTLDGHVLVELGATRLASTFSQGGGPQSHTGIPTNPITAGSSDGTAMLLFNPNTDNIAEQRYGERFKVVTNAVHGVRLSNPSGEEVRSSIYSIAANLPLPRELGATLVMYFDTPYQDESDYLRMYCLKDDATWKHLNAEVSPSGRFVTIPLGSDVISDDGTGTQLVLEETQRPQVECFRLFGAPLR